MATWKQLPEPKPPIVVKGWIQKEQCLEIPLTGVEWQLWYSRVFIVLKNGEISTYKDEFDDIPLGFIVSTG